MQFDLTLTLDGLMTLVAGIIAFMAVEHQIKVQRDASKQEDITRNRALAKAILFEIDSFYRLYIVDLPGGFAKKDPKADKLIGMKSISPDPFPIYHANAGKLGGLNEQTIAEVVRFYSFADAYIHTISEYKTQSERYYAGENPVVSEEIARFYWGQLKDALPELVERAYTACLRLSQFSGIEFKTPLVMISSTTLPNKDNA